MLFDCLFVGCGGFIGAVLRYLCGFIRVDVGGFPVVTLGINVIGSFAIMFLAGLFARSFALDSHLMLFLRVGLCGGFTTFSMFSAETLGLFERGDILAGLLYAVLSCALCIGAAFVGELVASAVTN